MPAVVGEDNIICAQTGLAGSSILGKNVLLAGQVGISGPSDHSRQRHRLRAERHRRRRGGGRGDVRIAGIRSREWLRAITAFPKLPDLLKTVRQLEKRLEKLEGAQASSQ